MKKHTILLFTLLISLFAGARDIRVMTFNVRHCAGMKYDLNLPRTGSVIEKYHPDFVAVQELDSCAKRSNYVNQLEELGKQTLMHPTFAGAIPLQGGKYGVGILSKERPINVKQIPMPNEDEDRVLLICDFKDCIIACTHLSLNEKDHAASAELIINEASKATKPFIIMGDWNSKPDSPFLAQIKEHFNILSNTKKETYPADEPKECIDYIAVYKGQGSEPAVRKNVWVIEDKVTSDHRPIVADIVLKTPAKKLMTTKPYLQDPRPTEMTIMFQTNSVCHAWIEYGEDSINTQKARTILDGQEVCYDIENRIKLFNLKPGQKYYYRVCLVGLTHKRAYETHFGDTLNTKFYSFNTPNDKDTDFTALIFNDLHQVKAVYDTLRTCIKDINYDLVIFNGDCLPEPYDRTEAIRMIHDLTDPINGAEKPIIFVRGNHEIRDFYSAGMHSLIGYRDGLTYGAFNWGDTRFIILDLGEDKPDDTKVYAGLNDFTQLRKDELKFLQEEFKSKEFKKASRRVLINHIPIYRNEDKYKPCLELWGDLIKNQPIDINFCAHEHDLKFFEKGTEGATFPIYRGGAPSIKGCAVAVLTKQGKKLNVQAVTPQGVDIDKDL